ncbi:hypothetical protein F0562_010757 [Nyssa sinensis]|uniref:Uncharacterized protein n=1 Tax=Nyssa sinensis TaxID=561372 RepID=A0A5J5A2A9_9ASTE|nr:hypothetical protein F0562_010757 [Nyssa sinensis]
MLERDIHNWNVWTLRCQLFHELTWDANSESKLMPFLLRELAQLFEEAHKVVKLMNFEMCPTPRHMFYTAWIKLLVLKLTVSLYRPRLALKTIRI